MADYHYCQVYGHLASGMGYAETDAPCLRDFKKVPSMSQKKKKALCMEKPLEMSCVNSQIGFGSVAGWVGLFTLLVRLMETQYSAHLKGL